MHRIDPWSNRGIKRREKNVIVTIFYKENAKLYLRIMHVRPWGQKNPSQHGWLSDVRKGILRGFVSLNSYFCPGLAALAQPASHPSDHEVRLQFLLGSKKWACEMLLVESPTFVIKLVKYTLSSAAVHNLFAKSVKYTLWSYNHNHFILSKPNKLRGNNPCNKLHGRLGATINKWKVIVYIYISFNGWKCHFYLSLCYPY